MSLALLLILLAPAPGPVDWRNHSYVIDGTTYTLANGAWATPDDAEFGQSLDLTGVHPVDVDGDGHLEYAVGLNYWGGGTGRFDELHIYRIAGKTPMLAGFVPGGDRGDGGHGPVRIDGSAVVLDRNYSTGWDGACCPSMSITERWIWRDGRMQLDVERSTLAPLADSNDTPDYAAELKAARAAMALAKRDGQKAAGHLLRALEARPGDAVALGELGFALVTEKEAAAEAALWAAVGAKGAAAVKAAALYNLAKLYHARGDRARAVDAAQRSLVLRPGNGPTEALLAEASKAPEKKAP